VSGQLGRHLVREFGAWPEAELLAIVRDGTLLESELKLLKVAHVDFSKPASLMAAILNFNPTAIVHCAATGMQQPWPAWSDLVQLNVNASVTMCEAAARVPGCVLIHVSSGLAYRDQGRPLREDDPLDSTHPYGATKAAADILVRACAAKEQVPLVVARPFSFSGEGDTGSRLFPRLLKNAAIQQPFELNAPEEVRDYCATSDIARGIALAVSQRRELPAEPQVFNFGTGNGSSLHQLVKETLSELGLHVKLSVANPGPIKPRFLVADIARAKSLLGWSPKIRFAHAIWELARSSYPELKMIEPGRLL